MRTNKPTANIITECNVQYHCTLYSDTAQCTVKLQNMYNVHCTLQIQSSACTDLQSTSKLHKQQMQFFKLFFLVFFRQITNFQFDNNFRCCTFAIIVYHLLLGVFIFKPVFLISPSWNVLNELHGSLHQTFNIR